MNDTLKQNIARMEKELAEMRETLARRESGWPDKLTAGMVFRHKEGDHYMTRFAHEYGPDLDLVALDNGAGKHWSFGELFGSCGPRDFAYIGLASDVLSIKS